MPKIPGDDALGKGRDLKAQAEDLRDAASANVEATTGAIERIIKQEETLDGQKKKLVEMRDHSTTLARLLNRWLDGYGTRRT